VRHQRPFWRRAGRVTAWVAGGLVAGYSIVRGIVEFFTVNYSDPASYHDSWGGPSLAGVLAVHSGPGLLALAAAGGFGWRRIRARRAQVP
jgi:hypothetical protein